MAYENVWFEEGEEKVVIVDDCERVVKRATIDRETGNFMFKKVLIEILRNIKDMK